MPLFNSGHFTGNYYLKFKHVSPLKQWFYYHFIDRREPVYSRLLRRFERNVKLLDFGCGCGSFAAIAHTSFQYVGVDFSKGAIAMARENVPHAAFKVGSTPLLRRFSKHSFSIITCFDVLEHLPQVEEVLSQFWRLLKHDGWLVVSVPIADSIAIKTLEQGWLGFEDPSHVRIISRSDWHHLFRMNGFIPIRCWSSGIINSPTSQWSISGWLKVLHFITQPLALLGFSLPAFLTDEDYYVLIKNSHFVG